MDPKLIYGPTAEISARAVFGSNAYLILEEMLEENFYEWKSGVRAPVYCNIRVILGHPGAFRTLVKALCSSIEASFPNCEYIVGMAEAGIAWSSAVALELGLPQGFVRKTEKAHGLKGMVVSNIGPNDKVVLVDDLMAGGGTAVNAISMIEDETGGHVIGVQTIVNWDFSAMRKSFAALGVPYRALVSYPQILDVAVSLGVITPAAATELRAFYRSHDPKTHKFNREALRRPVADGGSMHGLAQ